MMNVFVAPGDVFAEIKAGCSSTANWLVPVLLSIIVGIASVCVTLSQDNVLYQIRTQQEKVLQKKLQNMPQQQREETIAMAQKFTTPTLMKLFGSLGAVTGSFAWLFIIALVVWGLGRCVFKGEFAYMQAVEVCGLAGLIGALGGIVTMLLIVIMGNVAMNPGPILLVQEVDATNKTHQMLAVVNVMTLWYVGVLAVGLARLSGASFLKAALCLFSLWAFLKGGQILLGWGVPGM